MTAPPFVLSLAEIGVDGRAAVGGKAASLGELVRGGFRVPAGRVVTTAAFERALRVVDPERWIAREVARLDPDDHDGVARVGAAIRDRIRAAPLPAELRAAIAAAYRALDREAGAGAGEAGAAVAVRSSATGEDGADVSFAGLQDTFLWVRGADDVADRVRRCWASLYNTGSISYRLRHGLPEEAMAMGVVIQRMVDARCSGIMFTRSPTTGDRSVVAVEASWGLGSAVVSGEVTPDAFVVSKVTGEVLRRTVSIKLRQHRPDPAGGGVLDEEVPEHLRDRPCLSDEEVRELAELARRVERHYGSPQDVEWAISREAATPGPGRAPLRPGAVTDAAGPGMVEAGGLFLLQSRPETVWSTRGTAPVAAPKRRAFDHVVEMLGHGGSASAPGGGPT